jgi:hypothetical protein
MAMMEEEAEGRPAKGGIEEVVAMMQLVVVVAMTTMVMAAVTLQWLLPLMLALEMWRLEKKAEELRRARRTGIVAISRVAVWLVMIGRFRSSASDVDEDWWMRWLWIWKWGMQCCR